MHLVASRQTGTATSILRALLTAAGKDIKTKADGVKFLLCILPRNDGEICVGKGWIFFYLVLCLKMLCRK